MCVSLYVSLCVFTDVNGNQCVRVSPCVKCVTRNVCVCMSVPVSMNVLFVSLYVFVCVSVCE